MMLMRSVLFWDVTQHHAVLLYQCFRIRYQSHLQGSKLLGLLTPEDGTDMLTLNIGKGLPHNVHNISEEHSAQII
jgi:hypothetical protein